jgi:hypothetical protein
MPFIVLENLSVVAAHNTNFEFVTQAARADVTRKIVIFAKVATECFS